MGEGEGYVRPPKGPSRSSSFLISTFTSTLSFLITSDLTQLVDDRRSRERAMEAGLTNSVFFNRRVVLRRVTGMVEDGDGFRMEVVIHRSLLSLEK